MLLWWAGEDAVVMMMLLWWGGEDTVINKTGFLSIISFWLLIQTKLAVQPLRKNI
jgi:hypothetical protein